MLKMTGDTTFIAVKNLDQATRAGLRLGLYNLGSSLKRTANKEMLKRDKKGKTYRVRVRGRIRNHRSSAPGQTAANLSGRLRKSIDFAVQGVDGLEYGAKTPYARALELGNSKRNLEARPTLKNSIKANYRNGRNYLEQGIAGKL